MKKPIRSRPLGFVVSAIPFLTTGLSAAVVSVDFAYSQTSAVTGAGTISGMLDVGPAGGSGGMVNFTGTMPLASVFNVNAATTQVGAVGAIGSQEGGANDPTDSTGIYWTTDGTLAGMARTVTLTGSSGSEIYTVDVMLAFVNNALFPSAYDYTFQLVDDGVTGGDAVGSPTLASYLGSTATNGGSNRQTFGFTGNPGNPTWVAGADSFSRSFSDENAPGVGGPLGLYVGWREGDSLGDGTFSVEQIDFSGVLSVDEANIVVIPEPGTAGLLGLFALAFGFIRRRI